MAAEVVAVGIARLGTFPHVSEQAASGRVAASFAELQPALRISTVNCLWRALAVYADAFLAAWRQLKPNAASWELERGAVALRPLAGLQPTDPRSPQIGRLGALGYSQGALDRIGRTLEAYTYINPKLLVLCAALRESLDGRAVGGTDRQSGLLPTPPDPPFPARVPPGMPPLPRIAPAWAEPATLQLYADIVGTHGWHDIAGEFQTLAYWPQYLAMAWNEVAGLIRGSEYRDRSAAVLNGARAAARHLPCPVSLNPDDLRRMGYTPARAAAFTGTVQLFLTFLPTLVVTMELLRTAFTGQLPTADSPFLAVAGGQEAT